MKADELLIMAQSIQPEEKNIGSGIFGAALYIGIVIFAYETFDRMVGYENTLGHRLIVVAIVMGSFAISYPLIVLKD
ncbi:MAG: hypothetical protein IH840_05590 [Candidatus Heimdallarchaeota archaeon]|nr:hypothetical protein [Candidatus Heimdallarchaeota archaeon]